MIARDLTPAVLDSLGNSGPTGTAVPVTGAILFCARPVVCPDETELLAHVSGEAAALSPFMKDGDRLLMLLTFQQEGMIIKDV